MRQTNSLCIHKRILSVILALAFCMTIIPVWVWAADEPVAGDGNFSGGYGTEDEPYLISTAEQLKKLAEDVNGGETYSGKYFKLTADIDLGGNNSNQWTPIGTYTDSSNDRLFSGTFDGGGHLISGLYIRSSGSISGVTHGLFGYIDGTVKNLGVNGTVEAIRRGPISGGVVAVNNGGNVQNCYSNVTFNEPNYCQQIGGVVGVNVGTVQNCYNIGNVSVAAGEYSSTGIGGVVGVNVGTVQNCYNIGNVSCESNSYYGGVVGNNDSGTVQNCYFLKNDTNTELNGIGHNTGTGTATELIQAQFADQNLFSGWNFTDTWAMSSELQPYARPILKSCAEGFYEEGGEYIISTRSAIEMFRDYINGTGVFDGNPHTGEGEYFMLTMDVNLNNEDWTPIGTYINSSDNKPFSGTFDGGGHLISGLYINISDDTDNLGLFGYVSGGTIKRLGVDGAVSGTNNVGGVVGLANDTTIQNCFNTSKVSGKSLVGGVVGSFMNGGIVQNCYNIGEISGGSHGNSVGGIVGKNYGGTVQNCYNTGKVGVISTSTIETQHVGGVVGENWGTVQNCYNTGNISGKSIVGGVVGSASDDYEMVGTVKNCYNTGNVSGISSDVGGIVGTNFGSAVTNCYNKGEVTGTKNVGGVVGNNLFGGTVQNCYYLYGTATGGINGNDTDGAVSKTEAEFNSGEVTFLLQGEQAEQVWYQKLTGSDRDEYPVLTGDESTIVIKFPLTYTDSEGEEKTIYSNPPGDTAELPEGSSVTLGDTTVTLPDGGVIDKDGNITLPNGGDIEIGDTSASIPEGGRVTPNKKGGVNVPKNTEVELPDGTEVTLPDGGVIDKDGNIKPNASDDAPETDNSFKIGDTTVTLPEGGKAKQNEDGTVTVPDGSAVTPPSGTPEIEITDGKDKAVVDEDGNVTFPEGGEAKFGDSTVEIPESGTLTPDGEGGVILPEGSKVTDKDGNTTELPNGGILDKDGNIKPNASDDTPETDNSFKIGDTTVTLPEGGKAEQNEDGTVTVPDGSAVTPPSGTPEIEITDGKDKAVVDEDGNVTFPEGGEAKFGDRTVEIPESGTLTPDGEGGVILPEGSKVTDKDGNTTELPNGGVLDKDGNIKPNASDDAPETDNSFKIGDTAVTLPEGGKAEPNEDGTVTVPDGSSVTPPSGTPKIEITDGKDKAVVDKDGNVTFPEGGEAKIGDRTVEIPESGTLTPDGEGGVILPEGSKVTDKDGNTTELPNGGVLDKDGNIKPNASDGNSGGSSGDNSGNTPPSEDTTDPSAGDNNDTSKDDSDPSDDGNTNTSDEVSADKVSISTASGENAPNVTIDEESLNKLKEEVIADHLTPEEKAEIANGATIDVILSIEIVRGDIPTADKQAIEAVLTNSEYAAGMYLNIELIKLINGQQVGTITEIGSPIRVTVEIPEELRSANRVFAVVRVHNGTTEIIEDTDSDPDTVTIVTDKFSTYSLVYRNSETPNFDNPNTGITMPIAVIALASAVIVTAVTVKKRKMI